MTSSPWFLGIDLGTGSCKSVVIDDRARILGQGASGYESRAGATPRAEQDPEALVTAMLHSVRAAIREAGVSPAACQGFSLGGAYHSLMAVDHSGAPLTGVMTWVDDRATRQAQHVRQAHATGELYQQTGCPVHSMYPLYKLIWLREEQPHIFDQAARFISAKEYVTMRLTGAYLIDYGIAAGTGLLDTHDLRWNAGALALAGLTPDRLSPLYSPDTVIRELNPELAAQMGIPKNSALVLGSADAVNSSLGAGSVLPGQATCMIGTSGAFRVITKQPVLDPQARSWCYAIDQGHWLVGGAINNGGLALSWLRDLVNQAPLKAPAAEALSYQDLVDLAAQVTAGSGGLLCLPFFAGERSPYWNMNARGVFLGLALHHDLRHVSRAVLEGVAFRLRSLQDVLLEIGESVDQVRASGGFTRSWLWPQMLASVLDRPLSVLAWGETSSLGSAFWALLGAGVIARFEDLHPLVPVAQLFQPDPADARKYKAMYRIYMDLYFQLGEIFERMAGLN